METVRVTHFEQSSASCFMRIFDTLGFGTVLVGSSRQVLRISDLAKAHLGKGIAVHAGLLAATDAKSNRMLQGILKEHLEGGTGRDALGLSRDNRRPLILRVVALTEDMRSRFDNARLIAVLVDPEQCPTPSPALLNQLFGLTRKEADVAIQLMCGNTLQEMAQATGVGMGTLRAQSKAVFAKTGTKRQAELVGLLTRLATISYEHG